MKWNAVALCAAGTSGFLFSPAAGAPDATSCWRLETRYCCPDTSGFKITCPGGRQCEGSAVTNDAYLSPHNAQTGWTTQPWTSSDETKCVYYAPICDMTSPTHCGLRDFTTLVYCVDHEWPASSYDCGL